MDYYGGRFEWHLSSVSCGCGTVRLDLSTVRAARTADEFIAAVRLAYVWGFPVKQFLEFDRNPGSYGRATLFGDSGNLYSLDLYTLDWPPRGPDRGLLDAWALTIRSTSTPRPYRYQDDVIVRLTHQDGRFAERRVSADERCAKPVSQELMIWIDQVCRGALPPTTPAPAAPTPQGVPINQESLGSAGVQLPDFGEMFDTLTHLPTPPPPPDPVPPAISPAPAAPPAQRRIDLDD